MAFKSDRQRKHVMAMLRKGQFNTWQRRMLVSAGLVGGLSAAKAAQEQKKQKIKPKSYSGTVFIPIVKTPEQPKKPTIKSDELRLFSPQGNTIHIPLKQKTIAHISQAKPLQADELYRPHETGDVVLSRTDEFIARDRAENSTKELNERLSAWKALDNPKWIRIYNRAKYLKEKGIVMKPRSELLRTTLAPVDAKLTETTQLTEKQVEKKLDIPANKIEEKKDGALSINKKSYAEKSPEMLGSSWIDREGRENNAMFVRLIRIPRKELPADFLEKNKEKIEKGEMVVTKNAVFLGETKQRTSKLKSVLGEYEKVFGKVNDVAFILRTKHGNVGSPFLIVDSTGKKGNFFKSDSRAYDVASASKLAVLVKTNVPKGEVVGDQTKEKKLVEKMKKSGLFAEKDKGLAKGVDQPILATEIIHPSKAYGDMVENSEKPVLDAKTIGRMNAFERWIGANDRHAWNYLIKTDEKKPYSIDMFYRSGIGDNAGHGEYKMIGVEDSPEWEKGWSKGFRAAKATIKRLPEEKIRSAVTLSNPAESNDAEDRLLAKKDFTKRGGF